MFSASESLSSSIRTSVGQMHARAEPRSLLEHNRAPHHFRPYPSTKNHLLSPSVALKTTYTYPDMPLNQGMELCLTIRGHSGHVKLHKLSLGYARACSARGTPMQIHRREFMYLAALAAQPMLSGVACAQAYPTRPVRFIVSLAPGGGLDFVARCEIHCRLRQP